MADGVLAGYAIGGAIGASFYLPALQTEDVDAFVYLPASPGGLFPLGPIYQALTARGGVIEGAHVRFGVWPLQILTDANELIREAIREAITVPYGRTQTRVFRAEYLFAVALQTGRAKDFLRARLLVEQGVINGENVQGILERHGLTERLPKLGLIYE